MDGLKLHASCTGRALSDILRDAGVVGAGGAGFPTWAKYERPQPFLVTNAQESEPGYLIDKWLHREHADSFASLYSWLRDWGIDKIVVAAKLVDREWLHPLEARTGATVLDCTGRNRHDLLQQQNHTLFAYTDDRYQYGMETALLLIVAGKKIPQGERPSQHGFIVNNTETLWNMHRALTTGAPVTRKLLHVYGETPRHTFLDVAVGTPVADVIGDAGMTLDDIAARSLVVVDGGPGWFERIDATSAVVTRRTNSILVIDPALLQGGRKEVMAKNGQPGYPRAGVAPEQSPRRLDVSVVHVPLQDNAAFKAVAPARPVVEVGAHVVAGQRIASAAEHGISVCCHASMAGVIERVSDTHITIRENAS